jgi:hypothetical protein
MKNAQTLLSALPAGHRRVYIACDKCIKHLIKNGASFKDAENQVLVVLKEFSSDLSAGNFTLVVNSMLMIFDLQSSRTAAKNIIKSNF